MHRDKEICVLHFWKSMQYNEGVNSVNIFSVPSFQLSNLTFLAQFLTSWPNKGNALKASQPEFLTSVKSSLIFTIERRFWWWSKWQRKKYPLDLKSKYLKAAGVVYTVNCATIWQCKSQSCTLLVVCNNIFLFWEFHIGERQFFHLGICLAFACSRFDSEWWRNWCRNYFRQIFLQTRLIYHQPWSAKDIFKWLKYLGRVWPRSLMLLWKWQANDGGMVIPTIRCQNQTLGVTTIHSQWLNFINDDV